MGKFFDANTVLGYFGGHFRAKLEAGTVEGNRPQQVGIEYFVAGWLVGKPLVVQDVGQQGNDLTANVKTHIRVAIFRFQEPGPVNHFFFPFRNGFYQCQIILGFVFQVGILHNGNIARHVLDGGADGRPLSLIMVVQHHFYVRYGCVGSQPVAGAVGGAIIHNNNFFIERNSLDFFE